MTEKEAINYYKKAMQIHKDEFGDDQKAVDLYNTTINALQELQQYREVGTIDDSKRPDYLSKKILKDAAAAIESISAKLAYYEDLEKQRRLLKLPCALGDTVYRIHKATELSPDKVYKCRVTGVKQEYNSTYIKLYANINKITYSIWIDNWFDKCQMGYEFFSHRSRRRAGHKESKGGSQ